MVTIPQLHFVGATRLGRYWSELTALRSYFPAEKSLSILSFGCSTGHELLGVQKLFPTATLFGCEVDEGRRVEAAARLEGKATVFGSSSDDLERHGPYDVIMANSVLQRTVDGVESGIPALEWLNAVDQLDRVLKPGGVLQIINSNIAFRHHPCFANYDTLRHPLAMGSNFSAQFDLAGNCLALGIAGFGRSAHLHRHIGEAGWPALDSTDLDDIHFWKREDNSVPPFLGQQAIAPLDSPVIASGSAIYRPQVEGAAVSFVEVETAWASTAKLVRLERTARRIWFDGATKDVRRIVVTHQGRDAATFLESVTGRPYTLRL